MDLIVPIQRGCFNTRCRLPHGLTTGNIADAMEGFLNFLSLVNARLIESDMPRMEEFIMPANFSSIVGEYVIAGISRVSTTLIKNQYHNGHPDLIPRGAFPDNRAQHATQGVEVKASHYPSGWQGHNAENSWLMVFVFESNRPSDASKGVAQMPFRFAKVVGAQLDQADWKFSGRSETSRRTITASVVDSGFQKMEGNWIYRV